MRNKHIIVFILLLVFSNLMNVHAQNTVSSAGLFRVDTISNLPSKQINQGIRSEREWRSTGSTYTISGEELQRMAVGNLWNTLQGRIPGLTVMSGSGEPGYDSPVIVGRGLSSWNVGANDLLIVLDGFKVNMAIVASLSANEIESVTYLRDAAALAIYGLDGGVGALIIQSKRGHLREKTQITANARYGVQSIVELPTVMDAYNYTMMHNQARQNDGLTIRYANPELYLGEGDAAHPNVDWYDEVLKPLSIIQDYNLSFRGGGEQAKYFVSMNYTDFSGNYKDADAIDSDFGTNAEYTKFNLRGNVDLDITKNLTVSTQIMGSIEDKNTPAGFTAGSLFNNLMGIPASAFSVKNPDGSWGNSSIYDFNPVMLLQTGGIWSSHTRNIQTNLSFEQKLDNLVPGLNFIGAISFSNQYIGYSQKRFSGLSYELLKNDLDQPILDLEGNYTYSEMGSISDAINDGLSNHWNRRTSQVGFNYDRAFGKHSFTGLLLAKRQNYSHNGLIYQIRDQGISFSTTYDYDQKYIADLSASYHGSADFEASKRYGLFPAVGLAWVMSNESFMDDSPVIDYLKLRTSYGIVGNTTPNNRFLYEQWATTNGGWRFTNTNAWHTGRREGAIPNLDFTWERKSTLNLGMDVRLLGNVFAQIDLFTEKRSHIIEDATSDIPAFTGYRLAPRNTGEVVNRGFEAVLGYDKSDGAFNYYIKGMFSFARNEITKRSESIQPHDWLYEEGYRINQMRGLISDGFYEVDDFDQNGFLREGVVVSTFANAQPGDMKFKDMNNDGIINSYDRVPIDYSNMPEITGGLNLGFAYKGFDFDAFVEGVTNRTVLLPFSYTIPFVNNNNVTAFSSNPWTPETASSATSPRLTTQNNLNNHQNTDFYMRDGSFIKVRSLELGYTTRLGAIEKMRVFVNGTNLFIWDKIDGLEAERLSMGYPLVKAYSLGLKVHF